MARGLEIEPIEPIEPRRNEFRRTEADTYRTGYVPNPNIGIANSEFPSLREPQKRMARSEVLFQRGQAREIFARLKHTLSPSKTSL